MIGLYFRLIWARIRAQMQYKLSFVLEIIGFGLLTGLEFMAVALVFTRFPSIAGWTLAEIGLLYGISGIALGLAEGVGRGFDLPFEQLLLRGGFDVVLTRPLGSFYQILASEFQLRRLGRLLQGLAVLAYSLPRLPIEWSASAILLLALTLLSGALIYLALTVFGATVCFWTIKTPELINIFTVGGNYMVSHPLSIYSSWLRSAVLIVPLAFVNYPAALTLLRRDDPGGLPAALAWAAPLAAGLFLAAALRFWRFGVSKYQSTGS